MDALRPRHIRAVRTLAVWALRSVAIAMIAVGLVGIAERLVFGIMLGSLTSAWQIHQDIGQGHGIYRGVPLVAIGAALGLLAKPIARWAITLPTPGCPACGHAATTADGTCTECGLPDA